MSLVSLVGEVSGALLQEAGAAQAAMKLLKSGSESLQSQCELLLMMIEMHKHERLPLELLLQEDMQKRLTAFLLTPGATRPFPAACIASILVMLTCTKGIS